MTVSIAAFLSLGICLAVASTLLGNAGPFAVTFGLSPSNLTMTSLAAIILFVPTMVTSLITYVLCSENKRWLTLIPAVVIPLLGGFGFFVFIGSGLG